MLLGFVRLASGRLLYDDEQPPLSPNINDLWVSPQNQFWFWSGHHWLSCVPQNYSYADISDQCMSAWWQEGKSVNFSLLPITFWGHKILVKKIGLNLRCIGTQNDTNFCLLEMGIDVHHIVTVELRNSPKSILLNYDTSAFHYDDFIGAHLLVTGDPGPISGTLNIEYQLIYSEQNL